MITVVLGNILGELYMEYIIQKINYAWNTLHINILYRDYIRERIY